ncbi:hypothetical protein EN851_07565 [Mesorhizobium sp. M8A.F.Ca.ET.208.01.1.1]|uniref:hypothetical protein n=1 Tax=unclassified Mesorhizobium TaxID=325217 RepID=UPI0010939597|nr:MULTISPECIES: hypothetical protein [unclassified Mesorhizobium]TGQ95372.1 hypothetical protein EN851_07565 [Mesorhizobium sp. M8A.F.Ca.ET.208.01.1.1]TGT55863.1 hypothetical protein EN810_07565 [Mesorhizobium sp. M8A.F.Ca.ET.167.01.1.1]
MTERIVSVAISAFGIIASLPAPARHGDVLRKLWDFNQTVVGPDSQGFLTSAGRYVNRRDAAELALGAGQCDRLTSAPALYSEDLW